MTTHRHLHHTKTKLATIEALASLNHQAVGIRTQQSQMNRS